MWSAKVLLLLVVVAILPDKLLCQGTPIKYPSTRRDPSAGRLYNGLFVSDPYQWMEKRSDTEPFVGQQQHLFSQYMASVPHRDSIKTVAEEVWNLPTQDILQQIAENAFISYRNSGTQSQNVLYIQDSINSEARLLIDPNTFSDDGTVTLGKSWFTEDGSIWAYQTCGATGWCSVRLQNLQTGVQYPEVLSDIKNGASMVILHDLKTLIYVGYMDEQKMRSKTAKIFTHTIGNLQYTDSIILDFPHAPDNGISFDISSDYLSLIIYTTSSTSSGNSVHIGDLTKGRHTKTGKMILDTLVPDQKNSYSFVANIGTIFIFKTFKDAPNGQVVKIDRQSMSGWMPLVVEDPVDILQAAFAVYHRYMIIHFKRYARSVLQLFDLETGAYLYTLPEFLGSITNFGGAIYFPHVFYQVTTLLIRGRNYHYDLSQPNVPPRPYYDSVMPKGYDPNLYVEYQTTYLSTDGTEIVMYLAHEKSMQATGQNPVNLIIFQAGSGAQFQPEFNTRRYMVIKNLRSVYAVPLCRGGSELGEAWHEAGMRQNKQYAIDDAAEAALYLLNRRYTNPDLLSTAGADENGALVAVAAVNRNPNNYGCLFTEHGFTDMLNYQLYPNGQSYVKEYGVATDPGDFQALIAYSPYQNMRAPQDPDTRYPATLVVISGRTDATVFQAHGLKFTAALQFEYGTRPNQHYPLVMWFDRNSRGPVDNGFSEIVTGFYFLVKALGLEFSR